MDKATKKMYIQLAYASTVGIGMVIAIFGCLFIGAYLDRQFETGYKLTIVCLLIGVVAGFRNLFYIVKKYFPDEKQAITCVKNEQHRKRPPPKED
jgi:ATP synthase protein I